MTLFKNIKLSYLAIAIATTLVMAYVVLPQLPQIKSELGLSTSAEQAEAWGTGDYGGGCCGGSDSGDTGNDSGDHGDGGGSNPTPTPVPEPRPASCDYFEASSNTVPYGGGYVTLTWRTSDANSVRISDGVGSVSADGSTKVFVNGTVTFSLDASGVSNTDTCQTRVTTEAQKIAVCDSFTASPKTLPYGGGNVTLKWNTTNADSVRISDGVGNVSADGSKTVFVNGTVTFSLDAIGASNTDTCTTKVTTEPKPPVQESASCDYFEASSNTVPYGGGNVTLKWNTTNADSVYINNGVGSVSADGSKTVFVSKYTVFTLTASAPGGNDTCQTTVKVKPPVVEVPSCDYLNASDTYVQKGDTVTLSWGTTNASNVYINNGVGNVSADGSKNVVVNSDITYKLTATNDGKTDDCTVAIKTYDEPQNETPYCNYLHVSDSSVEEGDRVTLTWDTTNTDSVYIDNGIGYVSTDGSKDVRVYDDVTFTLYAKNGSKEDTCTVDVNVDNNDDHDDPRPSCDLNVSDRRVKVGDEITLSWDTSHADDIQIEDDNGHTVFDTDDYRSSQRKKYYDGEIDVRVYDDTEFTLTARGDGGKRECDVSVYVEEDNIAVYQKRDQDLVIALTQVPYTGFEAGPFLTYLFYGVLTLWALFIAYILVIKKSSVLGFSLYSASAAKAESDLNERKKVEALVAKYAHRNR